MYSKLIRLSGVICFTFFLDSCNQMPGEVRLGQLVSSQYYREERQGDVLMKKYFYYKPAIYHYGSKPYTGRVKDFTAKEELKSEGFMKDGFPDGHWVYYNANGTIKAEGHYKDGVKDSLWISNYTDGSRKLEEKYLLKNDTLQVDTLNAWYYTGNMFLVTSGDTVRRYYKSGRMMSKVINGAEYLHEAYLEDGTVYFRKNSLVKESFYTNGKLRGRTYYLHDKKAAEMLATEKHKWAAEEKEALKNADSVFFDYSSYWDPVIKIYVSK